MHGLVPPVAFLVLLLWAWKEGEISGETACVYLIIEAVAFFTIIRMHWHIFWFLWISVVLAGVLILKIFKHDPEIPNPLHHL